MKKFYTVLIILLITLSFNTQAQDVNRPADPFCRMINTIYALDALRFNAQFKIKQVFEDDTVTSHAHVVVKKNGTTITFLQIIPVSADKELLFCNDSAWIVNHEMLKMDGIGTSIEALNYNEMSSFFPFTLFSVDTLISRIEPYWKTIDKSDEFTTISLDIAQSSKDISDIRVEFTISNHDFLPYRTLQESTYMKADKNYQEQIFSNYTFPAPDEIAIPDYFTHYDKDLGILLNSNELVQEYPDENQDDVLLDDIKLFNFSGKEVVLPEKGLVFIDLWYVGCAPCMKSAPVIEKIYQKYSKDLHFISINETDHDTVKIRRFIDKMGISFPVLLGEKGVIATKVTGRNAYPVFIILDAGSKKVLWTMTGFTDELEELITEAINENQ